jgi:uncharacterized membrane protein YbhN (UPF0104 family)
LEYRPAARYPAARRPARPVAVRPSWGTPPKKCGIAALLWPQSHDLDVIVDPRNRHRKAFVNNGSSFTPSSQATHRAARRRHLAGVSGSAVARGRAMTGRSLEAGRPAPGPGLAAPLAQFGASVVLAGGVLGLLVVLGGLTLEGVWQAILKVPVWAYAPIAAVHVVTIALSGWKWRLILAGSGGSAPGYRDAIAATTLGTLGGQVLPTQLATPMARAWIGRRGGISPGRSLGTSLLEQAFELIVLISMALVGLAAHVAELGLAAGAVLALAAGAVMTLTVRPGLTLGGRALGTASRLRLGRPASVAAALAGGFAAAARLPHRILFALAGMSFLRYALLATMNVAVLTILVPGVPAAVLFAAFPAVLLATALPFFPGGLGAVEVTWSGVLVASGVSAAEAGEAAIAVRIILTSGFLAVAPALLALRSRRAETTA